MKNTRIVSFVLVLALLVSVFSVLPVAAEESNSTKVDIIAKNVAYGERVQIAYAVNVAVKDAANVTVEYYIEGAPETTYKAKLFDTSNSNNIYTDDNGDHPVFGTIGFHATNFTDVVYATAYTGDEAPADAEYTRYSVAEYFYTKLYRDGFISKTYNEETGTTAEKLDSDRRNLYLSMMNYGRYAQEVLINNKNEGTENDVVLITDYCFLWSDTPGLTINGHVSGFYKPGTEVTFACNGADGYAFTDMNGVTTEASATYTTEAGKAYKVTATGVVKPDETIVTKYDSGKIQNEYVKTYWVTTETIEGEKVETLTLVDEGAWATGTNKTTIGMAQDGDNDCLQVRADKADTTKTAITKALISNTQPKGKTYTFEFKMNIVTLQKGYDIAEIAILNNNGGDALNLMMCTTKPEGAAAYGLAIKGNGTNSSIGKTILYQPSATESLVAGKWITIKVELYFGGPASAQDEEKMAAAKANTFVKLYVNENLVYDANACWAMGADVNCAAIRHIKPNASQNVLFDDISFTQTDKTYVATQE